MTTTQTTLTVRNAHAITGKSGKISATAERALRAINSASVPVRLALAMHGSAIGRKTAATVFDVLTLDHVLTWSTIDGSQWPDVYALLADRFGYAIEGSRGKSACRALVAYAQTGINAKKVKASQDGCTEAQEKRIRADQALVDTCVETLQRWEDATNATVAELAATAT